MEGVTNKVTDPVRRATMLPTALLAVGLLEPFRMLLVEPLPPPSSTFASVGGLKG